MIRKLLLAAVAVSTLAVVACKPAAQAPAVATESEAAGQPTQPVADQPTDQAGTPATEESAGTAAAGAEATASTDAPDAAKK